MFTVGVDLAAEPKGTAVAKIHWVSGKASLVGLQLGATDEVIVGLALGSAKIGIDCALGWPTEFVSFIANHAAGIHELTDGFGSSEWRRGLSYRQTDRAVRSVTGRWPLSVATDRLGVTALRCAGLVSRLAEAGFSTSRDGSQDLVEIYPAASMKIWGFETAGYRDSADKRARLLVELQTTCPWLYLGSFADLMTQSCDAFDAVIAALAARSAAIGKSTAPAPEQVEAAKLEGWIALPLTPIADLAG